MDPVTVSVTIDRPREEIFDYLADIANHGEFMDHFFKDWRLTRVDSWGTGAGARYKTDARFDRFGWGELNVLSIEDPRRIEIVGRGGKFGRIETYGEWLLEPESADSTRVTFTFESAPPLLSDRFVEAVAGRRRWFRRGARKALRRLRAILEEGRQRGQRATVAGL